MKEEKSFDPSAKLGAGKFRTGKKRKQTLIKEITGRSVVKLLEKVIIFPRGNGKNKKVKVTARVDTGASMSSIDEDLAKDIGYEEVIRLDNEKGRIVKSPYMAIKYRTKEDEKEMKMLESIPGVKRTVVMKSSHGRSRRIVIPIVFKIKGIILKTEASIISRAHLKYPLIIGRKDLRKFIIDPKTKKAKEKLKFPNEENSHNL